MRRLIGIEKEVVIGMSKGRTTDEIALSMNKHPTSIRRYKEEIFKKFGVVSEFQAGMVIANSGIEVNLKPTN